ncbi:MAG TPA: DUF4129 domain-containing protein [Ktedonobacteraceae bacterium]
MNSSPQSMKDNTQAAPAQQPFNWIEILAIPIASSIMETQPIILILLFLEPTLLNVQNGQLPINQVVLTLVLLCMQWWAWLAQYVLADGEQTTRVRVLHIAGLVVALLVSILITIYTADNIVFDLIVNIGIVLWAWKRGLDRTHTNLNEEQLTRAFRFGFIITITLLAFMLVFSGQSFTLPIAILAQALPLFFLSGLLSLSLTRLLQIQKEHARHPTGKKDPTRSWALTLMGLWIAMVIVALALETFSFTLVQRILIPIWNLLGTIVIWILEIVFFLISSILNFFFKPSSGDVPPPIINSTPIKRPVPPPQPKVPGMSPELILIGRIALLVLAVVAVLLFVRLVLGHLKTRVEDDAEEEERESLDIGAILHERREERQKRKQKQAAFALEPLDPHSARARYREMLIALQEDSAGLSRQAAETPQEYQQRLALAIKTAPPSIGQPSPEAPAELAILEELTRAYAHERYGTRSLEQSERSYLGTWVPHLIQRLYRPKPVVQKQSEDHWGM